MSLRSTMLMVVQIIVSPIVGITAGAIAGPLIAALWSIPHVLLTLIGIESYFYGVRLGDFLFGFILMAYLGGGIGLPIGMVLGIFYGVINHRAETRREWVLIAGLSSGLATAFVTPQALGLILLFAPSGIFVGAVVSHFLLRVFGRETDKRAKLREWAEYLLSILLMTVGIYEILQILLFSFAFD